MGTNADAAGTTNADDSKVLRMPGEPEAGPAGPGWMASNQNTAVIAAFILIAIYVAPLYFVALAYWQTDFETNSKTLHWFSAFMASADSTLNQFHKILFPVISGISVVAMRDRPTNGMLGLGAFVLLSILVCVGVSVIFDMKSTRDALGLLEDSVDTGLAKAFFGRVQETLMMYLTMLLGIGFANAKGQK